MSRGATAESVAKAMDTARQLWEPECDATRGTTLQELTVQKNALHRAWKMLESIKPCCHSCDQFDMGSCRTHGPIPKEFQTVEGQCPDWRYDGIPF